MLISTVSATLFLCENEGENELGGGGHSPERTIRVRPAVKTPFPHLSGNLSDLQLHYTPVLKTHFLKFLI